MPSTSTARESVFRSVQGQCFYKQPVALSNYISSSKDSLDYVQRLGLQNRLEVHSGCVNTIHWNDNGDYIVSGSDDQCIAVTNPHTQKLLLKLKTEHRANIFSARFIPQTNDMDLVSCSGDGIVLHTQLYEACLRRSISKDRAGFGIFGYSTVDNGSQRPTYKSEKTHLHFFNCHKNGTAYDVLTIPYEPRCFMSCGEDCTVRFFDLRQISSCHKTSCKDNILVFSPSAVNAMDMAPVNSHYLAVGCSDAIVRIYDRRYLSLIDFSDSSIAAKEAYTRPIKAFTIPIPTKRHYRVTSVKYSPDESDLLVSYSSEYLYLFDLKSDGINVEELQTAKRSHSEACDDTTPSAAALTPEQVTRRLRLRGDWSDTGPEARPDLDPLSNAVSHARPQLHTSLMRSMTDAIARMLNDPRTRSGLAGQVQEAEQRRTSSNQDAPSSTSAWRSSTVRNIFRLRSSSAENSTSQRRQDDSTVPADAAEDDQVHTEAAEEANNRSEDVNASTERTEQQRRSSLSDNFMESHSEDDETSNNDTSSLNEDLAELDMHGKALKGHDRAAEDEAMNFDYLRMKFVGHRNARTMIKEANFWGNNYVMSGSDCGHIFIWDRKTGKLVKLIQADQHVVNCLQPHPQLPYLATSGIDYDIKIFAPILERPDFDEEHAEKLMKRNAVMLEQTKDTITVPAAFMIRMLACIHSLRNRDRSSGNNNTNSPNNDNESSDESGNSPGQAATTSD